MHIVGVANLVIEMDAQYVRGMLTNPDIQPSAAINRWISAIQLFDFKLVHIPAEKHLGPDGLSRHEPIPGEDDGDGDPEEWVDDILSFGLWLDTWEEYRSQAVTTKTFQTTEGVSTPNDGLTFPPLTDRVRAQEKELPSILELLSHEKSPNEHTPEELERLRRQAQNFFVHDNRLWQRNRQGRHQLVILQGQQCLSVTRDTHDRLGHKGFYSMLRALLDRF